MSKKGRRLEGWRVEGRLYGGRGGRIRSWRIQFLGGYNTQIYRRLGQRL